MDNQFSNKVEMQRAQLRQMLRDAPQHAKAEAALQRSFTLRYIREAAQRGIFIGYCPDDALLALDIAMDLKAVGLETFFDEVDVPHGRDWQQAVDDALANCGIMLVILSPAAMRNQELQASRLRCLDAGKIVIPVLAGACPTEHLPERIAPIDICLDYQSGLEEILALLGVVDAIAQ